MLFIAGALAVAAVTGYLCRGCGEHEEGRNTQESRLESNVHSEESLK